MPEQSIHAELSPAEYQLVQALRELPESALREKVHGLFGELLWYVRNPRCQGMGVEGFPCGEPASSCEECHQVWDLLEQMSAKVARV